MTMKQGHSQSSVPPKALINLRVSPSDRDLIDNAAARRGKNRSEFMLDAARSAAEDALPDRVLFRLDPDQFAAFAALLDEPPKPNERRKALVATPAPWDE